MTVTSHSSQRALDESRWKMLAILSLAIVLSMTTWFSATAIVSELRAVWSLDAGAAAWLTNAVQIGFVVGALGASFFNLPDVVSARTLMSASAALAAAANLALLAAPNAEVAIALRFITGMALAGVYPPALKLISTWFVRGRGLALGCVIAALTLGSAFPHLLRAITTDLNWKLVVSATSIMTVGGALLMARYAVEGPNPFARATFDPRQIGRVLRDKPVMLANIGYFGHMWELYAMWGWFLAFAQAALQERGLSTSSASLITFAVIGSGIIGCVVGGAMADRIGRTATTSIMMALSGLCALLIGFSFDAPLWVFLLISVVWGVTVIGDSAQFSAIVTEVGESSFVGTALALQLGLGFALTVIAIRVVPMLADYLGGWQWAFLVLVPGPVIGTIAMFRLRHLPEAVKIGHGLR
ncbi:MFS transporter [Hyphomicrobium facile]|uniref:Predicted arabinose efflux permease, MFS family n=1 Tax=Hyphomicrobium facile TaxID=51670 RepID=A0A1I7NPU8_9HYPH|nr:MFS transporter [Hyphomicrobium facile]SFV36704.1 Predicted arabinose efflux permease, MFS family [Hyphomicrobium facile]